MLRHVAGVAEIVEDVNEAVAFYRDVLGLTVEKQDGDDYAMIAVEGVLHFGIWNRSHAAESVFGSRDRADEIPLGFTLEFEVESAKAVAQRVEQANVESLQSPRVEPWGQTTFRTRSPGGSLLGFAETPWARKLARNVSAETPRE